MTDSDLLMMVENAILDAIADARREGVPLPPDAEWRAVESLTITPPYRPLALR